jgi:hypothetical protein
LYFTSLERNEKFVFSGYASNNAGAGHGGEGGGISDSTSGGSAYDSKTTILSLTTIFTYFALISPLCMNDVTCICSTPPPYVVTPPDPGDDGFRYES